MYIGVHSTERDRSNLDKIATTKVEIRRPRRETEQAQFFLVYESFSRTQRTNSSAFENFR